ncbi:MAG: hypothetical protein WAU04_07830 [Candidatus Nitrotoga sp.]
MPFDQPVEITQMNYTQAAPPAALSPRRTIPDLCLNESGAQATRDSARVETK